MRALKPGSLLGVLEAAYELDSDDPTWLANLGRQVRPFLDGGKGMTAYFYDASGDTFRIDHRQAFDMSPEDLAIEDRISRSPAVLAIHRTRHVPLDGALEAARSAGLGDLRGLPEFAARGITDSLAMRTIEPGYRGVGFAAGWKRECVIDARSRRLWARIATHLAAARRLRAVAASLRAAEAILTPTGKLEHAEGESTERTVRELLRAAVLRQEAARSPAADPERAVEAWTALVSGRWTLVDRFERGGRRYLIAHRNEITVTDPRALTPRERVVSQLVALGKSNKLVAYELGLSESTIGTLLSTAMRKLGVSSRVALIQLLKDLT